MIADDASFETVFDETFMRRNVTNYDFGVHFLPSTITRPMPIHVMQCVQAAADDEIIRRMIAIRNHQILKTQYEFQFIAFDNEIKCSSLGPEFSHHQL